MSEKLNEIFNIESQPDTIGELINIPKTEIKQSESIKDFDADYQSVRQNLKDLIAKGSAAIDGILHVASEGDSPRAYEVAGQLIKSIAETNKDLIELHHKVKQITDTSIVNNNQTQTKIDNAIFVGSTTDLQKMLRGQLDQIKQLNNNVQ
jgi:hypothetical protein